ncbi:MAG: hypothetical protein JSR44_16315 [Spirochaetes bacterium]|nr:hypothetical protein [Spirochaetota bacterium]
MKESLTKFRTLNSAEGQKIEMALQQNLAKTMQKKIERENRILWSSQHSGKRAAK